MFTHVVLFKLKENTRENVDFVANTLKAMEGKIPKLRGVEVGIDELHTERAFDVCLITRFDSVDDMNEYQIHPYHVNKVLDKIKPYIEVSKVADYTK
ncbi:Dabb family protein [Clostridium subterminale]|uniref:Dabb family protein n=1 Tax=Clostridium subterminale TaxID=1550 RepID=A0ABN1KQ39_CLOSU